MPAEWDNRHHVGFYLHNEMLPKSKRVYFDSLPQVRVHSGTYAHVPQYLPQGANDDPSACNLRVQWLIAHYPQQSSPSGSLCELEPSAEAGQVARGLPCSDSPSQPGGAQFPSARSSTILAALRDRYGNRQLDNGEGSEDERVVVEDDEEEMEPMASLLSARRGGIFRHTTWKPVNDIYTDFVQWAEENHKHLVRAWRRLDGDGNMSVSKVEFLIGLKNLRYRGDTKRLWKALDKEGTNIISFIHFAPESALDLARFKRWAELRFGSSQDMFRAFDTERCGKIKFSDFVKACVRENMPLRLMPSLKTLFMLLEPVTEGAVKKHIFEQDLKFLDTWKGPDYLFAPPDHKAFERFKHAVLQRHNNNPILAWRKALDNQGNMKLSHFEFNAACKRLEKAGIAEAAPTTGVLSLYCALDQQRSGWASLNSWDVHAHELVYGFVKWTREQFAKVSDCVKEWENSKGEGVFLSTFIAAVAPLQMSEVDVRTLFEGLSLAELLVKDTGKRLEVVSSGKITAASLTFLDRWEPDRQKQEELAWNEMTMRRTTLVAARQLTVPEAFKNVRLTT